MSSVKKKSSKAFQNNSVPLFIGDSHALRLMEGAAEINVPFLGGAACAGYLYATDFYFIKDDKFYFKDHVKPRNPKVCKELTNILTHEGPIISTVGFNTHTFVKDKFVGATIDPKLSSEKQYISPAFFEELVLDKRKFAIKFYTMLSKFNKKFYFLSSPRADFFDNRDIYLGFEEKLSTILTDLGGQKINLEKLEMFGSDGRLLDMYRKADDDAIHGNKLFGSKVLSSVLA